MTYKNADELSNFIPDEEIVNLQLPFKREVDVKEFTVEDTSGMAFSLSPIHIGNWKSVQKEPLRFERGVNLVFRDVISVRTVGRGGFELFANFFTIRHSLLIALAKYTDYKNVKIRWERPGSSDKLRLLDNVNAYEIRAYITGED